MASLGTFIVVNSAAKVENLDDPLCAKIVHIGKQIWCKLEFFPTTFESSVKLQKLHKKNFV